MRSVSEMFISLYVIAVTLSHERESIKYPVTKHSLGCYNFLLSFQKGCSMTSTSQVCYMLEKEKGGEEQIAFTTCQSSNSNWQHHSEIFTFSAEPYRNE